MHEPDAACLPFNPREAMNDIDINFFSLTDGLVVQLNGKWRSIV